MGRRASPVRTCVGCRERAAASELLRVVAVAEHGSFRAIPDPRRRLPGRGASLHPHLECLTLAERRRAFPRMLRVPGPVDLSAVRDYLTREVRGTLGSTPVGHPPVAD